MHPSDPTPADSNKSLPERKEKKPRLLEQLRQALHERRFGEFAAARYVEWTRRFILFHGKRHTEVRQLLEAIEGFEGQDVSTTMIYTHVMDKGVTRTTSPLDSLDELTPEELAAAVNATRALPR